MTARSGNAIVSSDEHQPKDILCRASSPAARNAQSVDTVMATRMTDVRVLELWNNQPEIMEQVIVDQPVTDRHADDLLVSKEVRKFSVDNKDCISRTRKFKGWLIPTC